MKFTFGMACYDDYDGLWMTLNCLESYHGHLDHEIVVVDNHPDSEQGQRSRALVRQFPTARYVPYTESTGSAQPRNEVFRQARGKYVVCMDSHVTLEPYSLERLDCYLCDNPNTTDLLQGPLIKPGGKLHGTNQRPVWKTQAYGRWFKDIRGYVEGHRPFAIWQQGLGLFCCRKDAWVGFHEDMVGFGGCETYIAEKFRQRGDLVLCLPFLKWKHKFRAKGEKPPYPNQLKDQLVNYLITARECGWDEKETMESFFVGLGQDVRTIVEKQMECEHINMTCKFDWDHATSTMVASFVCGDCGYPMRVDGQAEKRMRLQ